MERVWWPVVTQMAVLAAVAAGLTFVAGVPYFVTVTILVAWAAFGHLMQLDDDMPGGWSNLDNDPVVWRRSRLALALKVAAVVVLFWVMAQYPVLKTYRW
jgi:hypothetical protein